MTDDQKSPAAARAVESLLKSAKDLMADAQQQADDGRLRMIAQWIQERVDSLDSELLKEVRATIEALEKRQAASGQKP